MDFSAQSIFEQAVDDQCDAVASVSHDEQTYRFNTRFIRRDSAGFWFDASAWPNAVPTGSNLFGLTVTFEFGLNCAGVKFDADVRVINATQDTSSAEMGAAAKGAVAHCWEPTEVVTSQRRANFRTPVPVGAGLSISVWKVPQHWVLRDRPKPSAQLKVELIDLSTGGACLNILPHRVGPESVLKGDRLRIEMRSGESETILDAQVVYCVEPQTDKSMRVGIAFRKLETTIEGRRGLFFLNQVIGSIQRLALQQSAEMM